MTSQEWNTVTRGRHHSSSAHSTRGGYTSSRGRGFHSAYKGDKQPHRFEPIPDFENEEEEAKFTALQQEIPHIMMPGRIRRIAQKINIEGLSEKMLSEEWIEFQRQGWQYFRVVKPDDPYSLPVDDNYDILPLENKWADVVLFKKVTNLEEATDD